MAYLAQNQVYLTQANWFIDLTNGSDGYTGSNSTFTSGNTGPLKTYKELVRRWGTQAPHLRQNTTITFINSHTDDTDPVYCDPLLEHQIQFTMQGTRTLVASGTLGSVVAKNRSTGQLLTATLTSGLSAGQIIVNTSRSNSEARLYKNTSGNIWNLSQPVTATASPLAFPSEFDTWISGDNYQVYSINSVNLARFSPTFTDINGTTFNNIPLLWNFNFFDPQTSGPGGTGSNTCYLGNGNIYVQSCTTSRALSISGFPSPAFASGGFINCDLLGGMDMATDPEVSPQFLGGQVRPAAFTDWTIIDGNFALDFLIGATTTLNMNVISRNIFNLNTTYLASGVSLNINGGGAAQTVNGQFVWGVGTINLHGHVSLAYATGSGKAAATFLNTGGITLNGGTTAWLVTPATTPVSNKTLSVANLDTDLGATATGFYMVPGGASVGNGAI